ncbi:Influenza virus NS1A-binding protein homolog A [Linum perenne]
MAGGRKAGTTAAVQGGPSSSKSSVNAFTYSTRNLSKSDLAGVIFGCKHYTFNECLSKQLFGLPGIHITYVQKIDPGSPLFLFNYSDRKLHGLFEAASQGKMNIDPYAWIEEGFDYTPYPAQVKIRTKLLCQPLVEKQFSPIIAKNYYGHAGPNHFWFELDRAQTKNLISLFLSSPPQTSVSFPKQLPNLNTQKIPEASGRKDGDRVQTQHASLSKEFLGLTADGETSFLPPKPWAALFNLESTSGSRHAADYVETSSGQPIGQDVYSDYTLPGAGTRPEEFKTQKPWAALFSKETNSDVEKKTANDVNMSMSYPYSKLDMHPLNQHDIGWNTPGNMSMSYPYSKLDMHPLNQPDIGWNTPGNADEPQESGWDSMEKDIGWNTPGNADEPQESGWDSMEKDICTQYGVDALACADTRLEIEDLRYVADNSGTGRSSSSVSADLDGEVKTHEPEQVHDGLNVVSSSYQSVDEESFSEGASEEDTRIIRSNDKDTGSAGRMMDSERMSSGAFSISQILTRLEELELYQSTQDKKISSLEQELVSAKIQIHQLKSCCKMMESAVFPALHPTEEPDDEVEEPGSKLDELVLIAGGFNGSSWLPDLHSYSLSEDTLKPLSPMLSTRSYASAAKFNDELYLIGGLRGDVFYDQVESYNPATDQWTLRPSLNRQKGSLASISLDSKIFALGGGNITGCFAEVEMFDSDAGRWILAPSMLQKRFSPAAVEINGILYVVGGFDGASYLKSVERFDPREHSWTRLQDMNTRRSCLCVAVLNEKLYAFGGYDGSSMVASMEILDPRTGSWLNKESMNAARGYFGAFVMNDAIHVIGGLQDDGEFPDTVEIYKEGQGWEVSNLKGIGKRCFLSTSIF